MFTLHIVHLNQVKAEVDAVALASCNTGCASRNMAGSTALVDCMKVPFYSSCSSIQDNITPMYNIVISHTFVHPYQDQAQSPT